MDKDVTTLLENWSEGNREALAELMPLVYTHLRRQAAQMVGGRDHTIQPTALVHETFLELLDQRRVSVTSRQHFYGLAAFLMRRILVAAVRRRRRVKRGGEAAQTTLPPDLGAAAPNEPDLLAVHQALERLERLAPRQARLVEQRFFAGYSLEECAEILGISVATATRDWRLARAWLQTELKPEAA